MATKVKLCPKKLGREVETLRGATTLEQLSEQSGLSVEYLRNLEAGDVQKVKKKELKLLGRALKMPKPVIRFMGVNPDEVTNKTMASLARSTQDALRALVLLQKEEKEPEPKKKKKAKTK